MKVNIAILNFNGERLLKDYLPSVIAAAKTSKFPTTVTVIDNCSTDASVEFVRKNFPGVKLFFAKENKVYCSYNEFFLNSEDDVIVILNSDIKVDPGFLDPLIRNFQLDKDIFFVSSKMYFLDGVTYQGDKSAAKIRFGLISADTRFNGYESGIDKKGFSFSTGNGAFDRKKFIALGGFDEIYLPGRYEDVDLCFRAWKAGYKGVYEPESVIYHEGYGSFKTVYSNKQIQAMVFRNALLFMWKNIADFRINLHLYLWMLPRLLFFALTARFYFIKAFGQGLMRLPLLLGKKHKLKASAKLSDREVLAIIGLKNE